MAGTPCAPWVYDAGTPLRTSVAYGEFGSSGRKALVLADARGQVHAVDARSGELIWKAEGRHARAGRIPGAPVLHRDRILVPGFGLGRRTRVAGVLLLAEATLTEIEERESGRGPEPLEA